MKKVILDTLNVSSAFSRDHFDGFSSNDSVFYTGDNLENIKHDIDSFTELENNWDGYGGVAVLEEIAQNAKNFVSLLNDTFIDYISDIFPNPNGTITIDWENDNQEKLSLEIGKSNHSYFIEHRGESPEFFNGDNLPDLALFSSQLAKFFQDEAPRIGIAVLSE